MVEHPEREALGTFRPLTENDLCAGFLVTFLQQCGHLRRPVLSIPVHEDDGLAMPCDLHERQSNGNGSLVTEVPSQMQDLDPADLPERLVRQPAWSHRRG